MRKFILKCIFFLLAFVCVLVIAYFLKWPAKFDSHVYFGPDFELDAFLLLILYRFLVYLFFPIVFAILEKKCFAKNIKFWKIIIENFNAEFFTYLFISALYNIFGFDRLLGVPIFGSATFFAFLVVFIITTILNKKIPSIIDDNSNNSEKNQ